MASHDVEGPQKDKRNTVYVIALALLVFSGIVITSKGGLWVILGGVDIGVAFLTVVYHIAVTHKVVPRE